MNTKNLDAIKRMVTRLQSIRETDDVELVEYQIDISIEHLQHVVDLYEYDSKQNNSEEIRTE